MHVFVTGATGWVGSAVVEDLIAAGHSVIGLVRSTDKATQLAGTGAKVIQATLDDLNTLRSVASTADAVIHTAFNHDFSKFIENAEQDRRVIEALGRVLEGSNRPLLVTSGLSGLPRGATEADLPNPASPRKSEEAARAAATRGVRASTVRLAPSVHGVGDHGFMPFLIRLAQQKGVSAYLGDGQNCWAGVYRRDAARVYRLALEQGVTESVYHAIADEAVPFKAIAEAIGNRLGLPIESRDREHFGWFANMAGADMSASSTRTRELLGWKPQGPNLIADLDQPGYYAG
ncbi:MULTISPECIES: SDR family oxidoreductase [Serratia]|uniref:SDR family oxidoreductase n=1 Tax=Serratia TaxID=613 RepID=UPI000C132088|nr:SDR family oxidoreductase [Serratia marcescens]PHY72783.1 3-beta hydroxysteroid dehydrogenase [Serratia marcescens]PIC08428.1 3-beta hydroxysteroid dehydrogenase [Serratia marcescens]CAI2086052.1 Putative NADH-flavin reductase [Serratia marcescens]HAT2880614.1 SDR family oxidoreductase [Serratia marcescens]HAT2891937.1 SDR family oxidoreductase [Serratia marcescens]